MSVIRVVASLLFAAALPMAAFGQVGVSTCSCVPRKYTITFNFEGECGDQNVAMDRPGMEVQCVVLGEGAHVTDFKPVVVTAVDAMELTADLDKVSQSSSPLAVEFNHGDTFDTSSTLMGNEVTTFSESTVPTMIQLSILGKNAAGEEIVNVWAIKLSSDCGGAGMLQAGDSVGWAVLSAVEEPLSDLCPPARVALGGPDGGELTEQQTSDGDAAAPADDHDDHEGHDHGEEGHVMPVDDGAATADEEEPEMDETSDAQRSTRTGLVAVAVAIVAITWTALFQRP